MHTGWSHDCAVDPADLIMYAEALGLGAIAVTDHNALGGALETAQLARGRDLQVIPGEEIKTDGQGEVIGLFLQEEIPRGMSFTDTITSFSFRPDFSAGLPATTFITMAPRSSVKPSSLVRSAVTSSR